MSFKKHKAELEKSKHILELRLVQHLQKLINQKDFIARLSQNICIYPDGGGRAMNSSSEDSCTGSWMMKTF